MYRPVTFILRGGLSCVAQPKGNPAVHHNGSSSTVTWMLEPEQIAEIEAFFTGKGVSVTINAYEAGEDNDQVRAKMMEAQRSPVSRWPTRKCPLCPWFDPINDMVNPCGYRAWDTPTVDTLLEHNEKARQALVECPLPQDRD